jgi:hypothetical protein
MRAVFAANLTAMFLCCAPCLAQQSSVVGAWVAVGSDGTKTTLTLGADGKYQAQHARGPYVTWDSGTYSTNSGIISFTVGDDWGPKTLPVYHPAGTTGGSTTQEPAIKPPDTYYPYQVPSTDKLIFVDHGNAVTLNRQ